MSRAPPCPNEVGVHFANTVNVVHGDVFPSRAVSKVAQPVVCGGVIEMQNLVTRGRSADEGADNSDMHRESVTLTEGNTEMPRRGWGGSQKFPFVAAHMRCAVARYAKDLSIDAAHPARVARLVSAFVARDVSPVFHISSIKN